MKTIDTDNKIVILKTGFWLYNHNINHNYHCHIAIANIDGIDYYVVYENNDTEPVFYTARINQGSRGLLPRIYTATNCRLDESSTEFLVKRLTIAVMGVTRVKVLRDDMVWCQYPF